MTTTLINTNPQGAVDLYVLGIGHLALDAGAEFDVPDDVAEELLLQVGNYAPKPSTSAADAANSKPSTDA